MSKLNISNNLGSKSSEKSIKTKDSLPSKKSKGSGSFVSVHGSKFGRSVAKHPKQIDRGLAQTLSVVNSRVIRTIFNPSVKLDSKLPDLRTIESTDCIRELGKSMHILDYEFNFVSFWILDVLSKLIKDLQLRNVSRRNQNVFLAWFRFVLRCITVTGCPREEIFNLLQEFCKAASNLIQEGRPIPQPEEIDIENSISASSQISADVKSFLSLKSLKLSDHSKNSSRPPTIKSSCRTFISLKQSKSNSQKSSITSSSSGNFEDKVQKNLQVLLMIVDIIYQVFADRFMYHMISLAYSSPNTVTPVDIKIDFNDPKQLRPEPVAVASPKTKQQSVSRTRKQSKGKKGKKRKSSPSIGAKDENDNTGELSEMKIDKKDKVKGRKKSKKSVRSESVSDKLSPKEKSESKTSKNKKSLKKGKKSRSSSVKEAKDTEELLMGKSSKGKRKRSKGRKSRVSSLKRTKDETTSLEEKLKLFERRVSPEMEQEMEKICTKDQFILPLSEAVGKDYVENLIEKFVPQEIKQVEKNELMKEERKEKRRSRSSSFKKGARKTKSKIKK